MILMSGLNYVDDQYFFFGQMKILLKFLFFYFNNFEILEC